MLKSVAIGAAAALITIALACLLCAVLMERQLLPASATGICSMSVCALGTAAGVFLCQKLAGRARLPVSLGCAAMCLLAFCMIRALLHSGTAATWYSLPICGLSAVACALIGAGRGR